MPETTLSEAMRLVLHRHYPVYPVCDENGVLILSEFAGAAAQLEGIAAGNAALHGWNNRFDGCVQWGNWIQVQN